MMHLEADEGFDVDQCGECTCVYFHQNKKRREPPEVKKYTL
jgi:hypothetical protein